MHNFEALDAGHSLRIRLPMPPLLGYYGLLGAPMEGFCLGTTWPQGSADKELKRALVCSPRSDEMTHGLGFPGRPKGHAQCF